MESPQSLAHTYAVKTAEGVVIDRLLMSEEVYETFDSETFYPDCTLVVDDEGAYPIGHGAPQVQVVETRVKPTLDEVIRSLDPARKNALLEALQTSTETEPTE